MPSIPKILEIMRTNPNAVRFADALKVSTFYFGKPRIHGSHHVFKPPWKGEPWVNIQEKEGFLKPYQVKQILDAVDKLESEKDVQG